MFQCHMFQYQKKGMHGIRTGATGISKSFTRTSSLTVLSHAVFQILMENTSGIISECYQKGILFRDNSNTILRPDFGSTAYRKSQYRSFEKPGNYMYLALSPR